MRTQLGVNFGDRSDCVGGESKIKVWFRVQVPNITMPLLGDSYFFKQIAGAKLFSATR